MATRADIAFLQCRLIYEFLHFVLEVVVFQSIYKVILKNYYLYIIAQICHVLPYLVVKMSCQLIHELSFIRVYHE